MDFGCLKLISNASFKNFQKELEEIKDTWNDISSYPENMTNSHTDDTAGPICLTPLGATTR